MTSHQIEDMRTSLRLGAQSFTRETISELCDLARKGLQVEAMREAISRIADQTHDEQTRRYALETLADLEQALNERKET
jgi:hypothetical protein